MTTFFLVCALFAGDTSTPDLCYKRHSTFETCWVKLEEVIEEVQFAMCIEEEPK